MIRLLNILSIAILGLFLLPSMCMERIEPDRVGVRRSLEGGTAERDFELGYHLSLPFWHSWTQVDTTLDYLEFSAENNTGYSLRTRDSNLVTFDVIIPYRIKAGRAWHLVKAAMIEQNKMAITSAATGVMRQRLGGASVDEVLTTTVRQRIADEMLPEVNALLASRDIEATHVVISGVTFAPHHEAQLQNKQYFGVQGKLDEAKQRELVARQETDTIEKSISKDVAIKREEWNQKIEELRSKFELEIAQIEAEATGYNRNRRADADAQFSTMKAEGDLAEAKAEALGQQLRAEALASKAGRTFSAIEAARRFKMGDIQLNSRDPAFLRQFGGMAAWRAFFLGE